MDTKIQPVTSPRKRGPYRQHSTEFKRAVVAKSFVEGASVSRLAREFNINANQVFTWRRQFADLQGTSNEGPAAALLPVTVLEPAVGADPILTRWVNFRSASTGQGAQSVRTPQRWRP
jgi:transposase